MKFTLIRQDLKNRTFVRNMTLETFFERIAYDTKEETILRLRDYIRQTDGDRFRSYYDLYKLPRVYPAVELKKENDQDGGYKMKAFNGIILLDVNNIEEKDDIQRVKDAAAILPSTLAAITGASGKSVKILVKAVATDGTLPQKEDEAADFYLRAYTLAARMYGAILPYPVTLHNATDGLIPLNTTEANAFSFRMTLDTKPFYNAKAVPLRIPTWVRTGEEFNADNAPGTVVEDPSADSKEILKSQRISKSTTQLVNFLTSQYEFRFNTIMGYAEWRPKNSLFGFRPADERTRNSFALAAREKGLDVWDKDINRFLISQKVKTYNPIHEYLWRVHTKWDGKDHIRALASRVPTDNPHWKDWFYTWFLGMVAQWMGRNKNYGNSTVPLLISAQGYNKSTFCKSLIPQELQWGYIDNLVFDEKKSVLQAMSQFLLINLDEFNSVSPKVQEGFLKNLLQLANVKVKRPYGKHVEVFPRMASFIATANLTDILADPSGSRRFIGIELTGPIKINKRIDYEQLYAQAAHAVMKGEPYWFDAEQTALIMESNKQFQMHQPIEQFFLDHFDIDTDEKHGEYLTTTAIYTRIQQIPGANVRDTNIRRFGRWLKNLDGLANKESNQGTKYLVRFRE